MMTEAEITFETFYFMSKITKAFTVREFEEYSHVYLGSIHIFRKF